MIEDRNARENEHSTAVNLRRVHSKELDSFSSESTLLAPAEAGNVESLDAIKSRNSLRLISVSGYMTVPSC